MTAYAAKPARKQASGELREFVKALRDAGIDVLWGATPGAIAEYIRLAGFADERIDSHTFESWRERFERVFHEPLDSTAKGKK